MQPVTIDARRSRIGRCDRERGCAIRGAGNVHERTEWPACLDLCALAEKYARPLGARALKELIYDRGLAHAGLARDKCRAASSAEALEQKRLKSAHLGLAADEDRTEDPPIRRRSCGDGQSAFLPRRILSRDVPPAGRRAPWPRLGEVAGARRRALSADVHAVRLCRSLRALRCYRTSTGCPGRGAPIDGRSSSGPCPRGRRSFRRRQGPGSR